MLIFDLSRFLGVKGFWVSGEFCVKSFIILWFMV